MNWLCEDNIYRQGEKESMHTMHAYIWYHRSHTIKSNTHLVQDEYEIDIMQALYILVHFVPFKVPTSTRIHALYKTADRQKISYHQVGSNRLMTCNTQLPFANKSVTIYFFFFLVLVLMKRYCAREFHCVKTKMIWKPAKWTFQTWIGLQFIIQNGNFLHANLLIIQNISCHMARQLLVISWQIINIFTV